MSRGKKKKRHGGKRPQRPARDEGADAVELLDDVREVLLHMLLCQVCRACAGTGRAHVDNGPDGRPVFGTCECRNRATSLLREFDVDVPGAEEPAPGADVEDDGDEGKDEAEPEFEEVER